MKHLLTMLAFIWPGLLFSQARDSSRRLTDTTNRESREAGNSPGNFYKPEILTSGFIDVISNGQVNASARLIRLLIGEPGKISIPLSVYTGVSSNNFQNQLLPGGQRSNEQLANSFINPLSGLVNVSLEGIIFFNRKETRVTRTGLLYQAGVRILTGYKMSSPGDLTAGRPINFLNSYCAGGFYFQTGAWERDNSKNVGLCWLAGRYILCKSGSRQLRNIINGIETDGFYHGWSAGWGVEINNLVNLKLIYYNFEKGPEIDFTEPIYQFSFTYSLR